MKTIEYGEIINKDGEMPVLEIVDSTDEKVTVYHLVPFREYSFQVTDQDGSWDNGCSPVVGLGNLIGIKPNHPENEASFRFSAFSSNIGEDSYGKEFMRGLALTAIVDFLRSYINDKDYSIKLFNYKSNVKLDEFIKLCYDYVEEETASYRDPEFIENAIDDGKMVKTTVEGYSKDEICRIPYPVR